MNIRIATADDIRSLWSDNNLPTKNYFIKGVEEENIEFWTVEDEESKKLIGELYIFWDSEDKDEANGVNRAYLCAFRIEKDYQGRGLGSKLMKKVIKRIEEKGFNEITIGVDDNDEKLINMYNAWGFDTHIKTTTIDYHNVDDAGNPLKDDPYRIYLKKLK
ncbi:GNAT family N-acetyltransferase [Dethiothermospora halolimnae]|uniref:GNAT family N-acetyltransferase n=1 Tax=Dethiothermospora halolimnae TaxID=3114390 RepID=UPI003CCB7CF6